MNNLKDKAIELRTQALINKEFIINYKFLMVHI